jgi:hypothetical protein
VRLPRVLADEHRHFAVLKVAVHARAEHPAVHPELAGLLLRESVRTKLRAERFQCAVRISAPEMIPLTAPAVIKNRLSAVPGFHLEEALGDFGYRCVPVNCLEGSVVATPQRRRQPIRGVLVRIQSLRLFAGVAERGRMRLVAANAFNTPLIGAAQLKFDPAVQTAEDAGSLVPAVVARLSHRRTPLKRVQGSAFRVLGSGFFGFIVVADGRRQTKA